ncbi:MAG: hypothetical protein JO281_23360 [Pseudonocardiales bacterium]|nr:hypothetical protein [Pseudonocardiales bacterium]
MSIRANEFADRYVKLYNETDILARRQRVTELYAPNATYIFYRRDPFHGHDEIAEQVTYTANIYHPMGYFFVSANNAVRHHNLIRFNWVMLSQETRDMEMAGQNVVALDEDERILTDYQFHDKLPTTFVYNDGYEETGKVIRPAKATMVKFLSP